MRLDINSKLYKWTYHLALTTLHKDPKTGYYVRRKGPLTTTLCPFFWRAFVLLPLLYLFLLSWVVILLYLIAPYWKLILSIAALAALLTGIGISFMYVTSRYAHVTGPVLSKFDTRVQSKFDNLVHRVLDSTFVQGLKAIKSKVCPIIWFE